jgi:hypothetical protein
MKGKLLIGVDFSNNNEPIIEIIVDHASTDLRDKMLKSFVQSLGGDSNVLKIEFDNLMALEVPHLGRYIIRAIPASRSISDLIHPELPAK